MNVRYWLGRGRIEVAEHPPPQSSTWFMSCVPPPCRRIHVLLRRCYMGRICCEHSRVGSDLNAGFDNFLDACRSVMKTNGMQCSMYLSLNSHVRAGVGSKPGLGSGFRGSGFKNAWARPIFKLGLGPGLLEINK